MTAAIKSSLFYIGRVIAKIDLITFPMIDGLSSGIALLNCSSRDPHGAKGDAASCSRECSGGQG